MEAKQYSRPSQKQKPQRPTNLVLALRALVLGVTIAGIVVSSIPAPKNFIAIGILGPAFVTTFCWSAIEILYPLVRIFPPAYVSFRILVDCVIVIGSIICLICFGLFRDWWPGGSALSSEDAPLARETLFQAALGLACASTKESDTAAGGVLNSLDPWLYRHWFKPYDSDIEHGRYIAKSITFRHHTRDIEPTLADVSEFHQKLIQSFSSDISRGVAPEMLQKLFVPPFPTPLGQLQEDLHMMLSRTHTIHPLFKSLFMVFHQTKVSRRERFTVEEIDNLPVSLVSTGTTEGLSRPISFHSLCCNGQTFADHMASGSSVRSVRTSLKSAIRFIMDLEKREEGFWRGRLSPPLADHSVDIEKEARELGWDVATHGKLPLDIPSSKWVNRRKYTEWAGPELCTTLT
ncbi:hypothetical protein FVEG_06517 [Fusarium verticillioides 7600]|uniref:Uncharacterized protein n=1 Tax=Gibberella moniliformis (strain M3125 / FGSC 7600) TaxID=334819 RepID=W7MMN1_GIBM7|nr:hypothetical protein FVEG_06517 [Fusarium verticillioides 7600]EWG45872.1 hypothetical protein FVEG_06517 [Fusarium verticillioides 7600]